MKTINKLWIGLVVLIILCPIGLMLPEHFKAGAAWGEWGADEMTSLVGYIPKGLEKLSNLWKAPLPDYAFKGWEEKGMKHLSIAYIASAVIGIGLTVLSMFFLGKMLAKKDDK